MHDSLRGWLGTLSLIVMATVGGLVGNDTFEVSSVRNAAIPNAERAPAHVAGAVNDLLEYAADRRIAEPGRERLDMPAPTGGHRMLLEMHLVDTEDLFGAYHAWEGADVFVGACRALAETTTGTCTEELFGAYHLAAGLLADPAGPSCAVTVVDRAGLAFVRSGDRIVVGPIGHGALSIGADDSNVAWVADTAGMGACGDGGVLIDGGNASLLPASAEDRLEPTAALDDLVDAALAVAHGTG